MHSSDELFVGLDQKQYDRAGKSLLVPSTHELASDKTRTTHDSLVESRRLETCLLRRAVAHVSDAVTCN